MTTHLMLSHIKNIKAAICRGAVWVIRTHTKDGTPLWSSEYLSRKEIEDRLTRNLPADVREDILAYLKRWNPR